MRNLLINFLVALLSLVTTLLVCEAGIRVLQYAEILPVLTKQLIDKGDTPNKQVNARLIRSKNPVLYTEFDPKDPNINNAGFRGKDFIIEKRPGTLRIAILGDSVGYGYSVPLEQTFASLVEQKLSAQGHQTEVLNFSVNGYSTAAELELYKVRVREYRPDIIVLAYVLNDPLPAAFVMQSVGSAKKQVDLFKKVARMSQLAAWCYLRWQTLSQHLVKQKNYQAMYSNPDSWQASEAAISELELLTKNDGAKLLAVIFPLLLDFENYPMAEIHSQIAQTFKANNIPYIDLLTDFSKVPYSELRPHPKDDTHPNAEGHAIAAEKISAFIAENIDLKNTYQ